MFSFQGMMLINDLARFGMHASPKAQFLVARDEGARGRATDAGMALINGAAPGVPVNQCD